ncbi:MAG: hypothetical protein K8J08_12145 [Thermoanaerobaculia bacterium]|nr:hypothetical protein [Thermoanaerobaculia bacterium]
MSQRSKILYRISHLLQLISRLAFDGRVQWASGAGLLLGESACIAQEPDLFCGGLGSIEGCGRLFYQGI